jgi:hypothetical protein
VSVLPGASGSCDLCRRSFASRSTVRRPPSPSRPSRQSPPALLTSLEK